MKRLRWMFAWPALLVVGSGLLAASEINDKAAMFGPETVRKAQSELNRIEREYSVPVIFDTIESLDGKPLDQVFRERAKAANDHGIYMLVARREHRSQVLANSAYTRYLTDSRMKSVRQAMDDEFRKGNFDAGLMASIKTLDATLAEARADAGGSLKPATPPARRAADAPAPARRPAARSSSWGAGSLITIVLMILAALLVFRIIGSLFSAARGGGGGGYGPGYGAPNRMGGPGYGGPGYGGGGPGYGGGGGGGFMSSLFGGIGGAMAGNWLYDKMSGGHHGGNYTDQTGYGAGAGAADPSVTDQTAASGWDRPMDGGDDWGASNTADAGNAGGDWGGTGGGDWGGGDASGGGDWGGGASDGGGDWGGGNDNGGSW